MNINNILLVVVIFLSINFRRIDEITGLPGGSESMIFFGFNLFMLFYRIFFQQRLPNLRFENKLFLFWFLWIILIGPGDSPYIIRSYWSEIRNVLLALLTFINVSNYTNQSNIKLAFRGFILSSCFLGFLVLTSSDGYSLTSDSRLADNALGLNTNELGYYISLSVVLIFIYKNVFSNIKKYSIVLFLVFVTMLVASRKAILSQSAFLVSLYTLKLFSNRNNYIKNFVAAVLLSSILYLAGTFVLQNSYMGERLQRTTSIDEFNENEYQRAEHYQNFLPYLKEAPFTGIGILETLNRSTYKKGSHSEYISIINETGIVGGLLYFGVYFYLLYLLFSRSKNKQLGDKYLKPKIIAAIVFILLYSIGRWNYTTSAHFVFIAIVYAYFRVFSVNPSLVSNRQKNKPRFHEFKDHRKANLASL
jgi:hypothetical protein